MSLALATHGYLIDENISPLPVTPISGQGHNDPRPMQVSGVAVPEHPVPKPPIGGGGVPY